jgi:hypothetical protein
MFFVPFWAKRSKHELIRSKKYAGRNFHRWEVRLNLAIENVLLICVIIITLVKSINPSCQALCCNHIRDWLPFLLLFTVVYWEQKWKCVISMTKKNVTQQPLHNIWKITFLHPVYNVQCRGVNPGGGLTPQYFETVHSSGKTKKTLLTLKNYCKPNCKNENRLNRSWNCRFRWSRCSECPKFSRLAPTMVTPRESPRPQHSNCLFIFLGKFSKTNRPIRNITTTPFYVGQYTALHPPLMLKLNLRPLHNDMSNSTTFFLRHPMYIAPREAWQHFEKKDCLLQSLRYFVTKVANLF